MSDSRTWPAILARLAAAGWLIAAVLVVRIATNGTFTDLAVSASGVRTILTIVGLGLVGLGVALAVVLASRPTSVVFTASWLGSLVLVAYAIVQLALRHESAAVMMAVSVAISVLSILGWRQVSVIDQP